MGTLCSTPEDNRPKENQSPSPSPTPSPSPIVTIPTPKPEPDIVPPRPALKAEQSLIIFPKFEGWKPITGSLD